MSSTGISKCSTMAMRPAWCGWRATSRTGSELLSDPSFRIVYMFDSGQQGGEGRTPGLVLADRIVARDARIRTEELGTVLDLQAWLQLHSVDPTDPLARVPRAVQAAGPGPTGPRW